MNQKVSKPVFDYLYHHLADIHNRKMKIINSFSIDFDEYMKMLDYIKSYINQFERFLSDVNVMDGKDALPFVIYNCVVSLKTDSGESWQCCVTLPKEDCEEAWNIPGVLMLSCNSSADFELMLKRCGEKVDIERSGRVQKCTIKRIEPNPYIPVVQQEV